MDAPAAQQQQQVQPVLGVDPQSFSLGSLPYDLFRLLMEMIYAQKPNQLRNLRRVSRLWQSEYLRISKTVKTLCLVDFDYYDKSDIFEQLNDRFFGAFNLDKAVWLKLAPQCNLIASMLEECYPNVIHLVISQDFLELTNCWKGKITHFSLMVDEESPKLDPTDLANSINSMTALTHLDMDCFINSDLERFYAESMELMQPTLRKLKHFSVKFRNWDGIGGSVWYDILPKYLNTECTRIWFYDDSCVDPDIFKEGYPGWLPGLTHLCLNLEDTGNVEESHAAMYSLAEFAPKLEHLRLLHSNVNFSVGAINAISGLAQLSELHIGFNFYDDGLHAAFRDRAVISREGQWTNVRTLVLSAYAFNQVDRYRERAEGEDHTGYGTAFHFVAILSAMLPNVQHLTIIGEDRYPFNILEFIPLLDGFPQLLSFQFNDSRSPDKLTGKRETPEKPFRTNESEVRPALELLNVVEDRPSRRLRPMRPINFRQGNSKIVPGRGIPPSMRK